MVVLRVISGGYEGIGGGTVLVALMRKVVGIGEGGGKGGHFFPDSCGEWWLLLPLTPRQCRVRPALATVARLSNM